ncbi:hypothetical protein LV716_05410 [Flagellimonas sp. HMM57]|uniref:carbamoyltransferase family protein n=1 Tax=unclassified Flagellimonas TaxID=2644544 RepID=UPI0013D15523|nr:MULTISPECIES: carbamoyltransferase N-terminal domain-containing protein [unclassified Flagellimonas]UII77210.1 hypothetical protein LV716_05410 [Flagellimonas sp. HMM57]
MATVILGISAYFHDSAAAILIDGKIVAAAQEERFTRIKGDASFPVNAIAYVLEEAGLHKGEPLMVAFYEKPLLRFERLLETYHAFAPSGLPSFLKAMPLWLKGKLFIKKTIRNHFKELGFPKVTLHFTEHHLSHAASAFFPSPFLIATILTLDGVGEWATATVGKGENNTINILREQHFPHSLGLLYSAFTYYLGFKVNRGEYKVMGLASYGNPESSETQEYITKIESDLVDIRQDGSLLLNMPYFKFATHLTMTNDAKWLNLFSLPRRNAEDDLNQSHANFAFAVQHVLEELVLKMANSAIALTGCPNLVIAGGVGLNSVSNGKLLDNPNIENLWIQPAAGDAGGALGAAFSVWHIVENKKREVKLPDSMHGAFLGPAFTTSHIINVAQKIKKVAYKCFESEDELITKTVNALIEGKIVGWFQGRMEFGPRALGNRSILADPRNPNMQKRINEKIKFRESFRPFAPCVLEEDVHEYFDLKIPSPYMLLVRKIKSERCKKEIGESTTLMERLSQTRSDIPAVTHVDYSARIQTISKVTNPKFWRLLNAFKQKTGYGLLINTSFNVKDEPIVCNPHDALRCFQETEMDILIMEDVIFSKSGD